MKYTCLLTLMASMLAVSSASMIRKQPLTAREKKSVGNSLNKALQAMANHAGGSKWEACASMFPNGQAPADQNSPTWLSCKSEFLSYAAAASLVQRPLSSSDKQAVGAALTKALGALKNHAGGSKWEACTDMFPNGQPPADQSSPTWLSCKSEFLAYASAAFVQRPLSSGDKEAVGEALTKALNAMQHHGGGSKFEACADMFPGGQPPADQSSPTWVSCKSEFVAYAGASLISYKGKRASLLGGSTSLRQPLSSSDKAAVGAALNKALQAMQHHGGGSKFEACADMFPNGQPPADQNSPTWASCKSEFGYYAAAALLQQPLSSRDKQAVGQALTKALGALTNHAGGSKGEVCRDMFPDGKPPADQNSPTWVSCKDQFFALVGTNSVIHTQELHSAAVHAAPLVALLATALCL